MIRYVTDVPGYPAAHSPYSHAVIANGFVFVSGQIAVRPGVQQFREFLQRLGHDWLRLA